MSINDPQWGRRGNQGPPDLDELVRNFKQVLIPEINNGQLIKIIRDQYFVDAKGYHKIMGIPITKTELVMKLREMLGSMN